MPARASVVIPSAGRRGDLPDLVRTLLRDPATAELLVVVDGPAPAVAEQLHDVADPRLRVEQLPVNVGAALARLEGVRRATSELVVLLDDDVWPTADLVSAHAAAHESREHLLTLGPMPVDLSGVRGRGHLATRLYASEYDAACDGWRADGARILRELWLGNVAVDRADVLAAEQVLPTAPMSYHEDLDLGLRLAQAGVCSEFCASAAATHRHQRTLPAFLRDAHGRGRSLRLLEQRWGGLPDDLAAEVHPRVHEAAARRLLQRALAQPLLGAVLAGVGRLLAIALDLPGTRDLALTGAKLARAAAISRGYREQQAAA